MKRGNAEARSREGERAQAMLDRRSCHRRRRGAPGGEKSGHEDEVAVSCSERREVVVLWLSLLLLVGKEWNGF